MPYEIRVVTSSSANLQKDLSGPAADGWQLVSCWPEKGGVTAVMQRAADHISSASAPAAAAAAAPKAAAAQPASPAGLPNLDAVLDACLAQPEREGKGGKKFHQALEVGKFAAACGVEAKDMLDHLHTLGIQEKSAEPNAKDKWHRDHFIGLVKFNKGTLNLSVTHAPRKPKRK
mgnify:CR=1 FL=1